MDDVLAQVHTPADLAALSDDQLDQLAEQLRTCIRETVSRTGGHLASNLGVVELTIALHRTFDFASDRLLWDVGHQAYVHKLLTGRVESFASNRQKGGLSGFPDPQESPYDLAKVGHSSTAISTGVGVSEGLFRSGSEAKTVVVVGDGALTGGMAYEGLVNAGELRRNLLVILNDNGSFIDPPVGALHHYLDHVRSGKIYNHVRERFLSLLGKLPFGDEMRRMAETADTASHKLYAPNFIFEDLGFRYFGPVNGHDRKQVELALRRVAGLDRPVILHVHTDKGAGWAPSLADPLTYHGPKDFNPDTGVLNPAPKKGKTYSQIFSEALVGIAEEDERVVAITAAMPSGTGLRAFGQLFPKRMYDVGICEQHSFAFAQGLQIAGQLPVVAHYSTFAQRGYDQLFQELVVQRNLGVIVALDRGGLVGEDGETHQGLYDIGWSRVLPGTVLLAPKDGRELGDMLRWAHEHRQSPERPACYLIRYPKESVPPYTWGLKQPSPMALGKAEVIRRGRGVMIWPYGAMVRRAWEALEALGPEAAHVSLINPRFAKPMDEELLVELAAEHDTIITIEDHALPAGFGSIVSEAIADRGLSLRLHRWGVRDELVPHASRSEQLADQQLDTESITRRLSELLDLSKSDSKRLQFPAR